MLATAVTIATEPVGGDAAAGVQTLYLISGNLWVAGNLFFGLWLVPMGTCALASRWMPRPLGWVLVAGGIGYVLSGFSSVLAPGGTVLTSILTIPATIGEFWMLGYLLIRGVNRRATAAVSEPSPVPAA